MLCFYRYYSRMFSHGFDNNYTRPNDRGEFEVAHGVSAEIFSAVMVCHVVFMVVDEFTVIIAPRRISFRVSIQGKAKGIDRNVDFGRICTTRTEHPLPI